MKITTSKSPLDRGTAGATQPTSQSSSWNNSQKKFLTFTGRGPRHLTTSTRGTVTLAPEWSYKVKAILLDNVDQAIPNKPKWKYVVTFKHAQGGSLTKKIVSDGPVLVEFSPKARKVSDEEIGAEPPIDSRDIPQESWRLQAKRGVTKKEDQASFSGATEEVESIKDTISFQSDELKKASKPPFWKQCQLSLSNLLSRRKAAAHSDNRQPERLPSTTHQTPKPQKDKLVDASTDNR